MRRHVMRAGAAAFTLLAMVGTASVLIAQGWEARREMREGAREVMRERQEMRREIMRADTPWERQQAVREGIREIEREKREARREIRREMRQRW